MKNYDTSVEINHNLNWPYISYHPHRILIIVGSGSGKTNVLLNLIKHQRPDIDKIYLYIKDPNQSIRYLLMNLKKQEVKIQKIQKHSLIILKQLIMFMKILKTLIQQRKVGC